MWEKPRPSQWLALAATVSGPGGPRLPVRAGSAQAATSPGQDRRGGRPEAGPALRPQRCGGPARPARPPRPGPGPPDSPPPSSASTGLAPHPALHALRLEPPFRCADFSASPTLRKTATTCARVPRRRCAARSSALRFQLAETCDSWDPLLFSWKRLSSNSLLQMRKLRYREVKRLSRIAGG
ncbi:uncharacterized protein ACOB8E_002144 [Sarcophilus harrisii]